MWRVGRQDPSRWWDAEVFPRGTGAFIRRAQDDSGYSRELVAGTWGLIPWFAKEPSELLRLAPVEVFDAGPA